jgi:hypothetical protein
MIIDGHAHACGYLLTSKSIIDKLDILQTCKKEFNKMMLIKQY